MKASRKHSAITLIPAAFLLGLAIGAHAQSYIFCDNIQNTSTSTNATSNGLFWIMTNGSAPVLIHQDFNAAFYGGTNSTNLSLIASFSGTAAAHSGDLGPGTWIDPTGTSYAITGSVATAFFQIQAWTGNYTNYSAAVAAGAYAAQSAVFSNSVAAPPSPPPDLTGMPAIVLVVGASGNSSGLTGGPSSSGGTSPSGPSGPLDASISSDTCGLWLSVAASNATAMLILHNTRQSQTYYVWSSQQVDVAFTNWGLEATVLGAAGDTTETNIAMGSRLNLFFRVTEDRVYVTNTVFQGLSYADTKTGVPDSMGAVGPNHYIELLNGSATAQGGIAVYNKSGTNANVAQTNISGFFSVLDPDGTNYPTGSMADPRVLYDASSQAWVASAIDTGSHQVILAVSTNASNPTNLSSGWKRYVLRVAQPALDSDFDTLGLDGNGLYLSVVHRYTPTRTNAGHTVVAIKKPDIYLGTNIATYVNTNSDLTLWTLQPAVSFDSVPPDGYAWFVAKGPPDLSANYQGGAVLYRRLQWAGNSASWADTNWFTVSTTTNYQDYYDLDGTNTTIVATNGVSAPQSGGTVGLYYVGSRLEATTIRGGFLWTCHAIGLSTNGTYLGDSSGSNVTRSAMQWFKLQISADTTSLTLADYGRFFDTNHTNNPWWYYFPSLMVNCAGDMLAGFSGSTATNYISAFYTWRVSSGATLGQPGVIQAGTTNSVGDRFGDYSATTLDPSDDWSFWTVQQYANLVQLSGGSPVNRWSAAVARLRPNP